MSSGPRAKNQVAVKSINELAQVATIFETCARNTRKLADTPHNARKIVPQQLVQAKTAGCNRLARLYSAAASDCRAEAIKLKNGALPKDVLPTLNAGFQFFAEQLQAEVAQVQNILTVISYHRFIQPSA